MTNSSIWVLIASDRNATICSSSEGVSRLLREVAPGESAAAGKHGRRAFAWELMSELCRGAQNNAYDGVIIVAEPEMLEEIRRVTMPAVRKYLIAEIVGRTEASLAS